MSDHDKTETLTVYLPEPGPGADILMQHVGACDGAAVLVLVREGPTLHELSYALRAFCPRCRATVEAVRVAGK